MSGLRLPDHTDGIWFGNKGPDGRVTSKLIYPNRDTNGLYHVYSLPLGSVGIFPGRLRINGRWSQIQPMLGDDITWRTNLAFGGTSIGNIPETGVSTVTFFRKKNLPFRCEVLANCLGSKLDPVLRILGKNGEELARCDDHPALGRDCRIEFNPRRDGQYTVEIRDVSNGSGTEYSFVLRLHNSFNPPDVHWEAAQSLNWLSDQSRVGAFLKSPERKFEGDLPNDKVTQAEAIQVPSVTKGSFDRPGEVDWFKFEIGEQRKLVISAKSRELGWPCDPRISLWDSAGKALSEATGNGSEAPSLTNTLAAGSYRLKIEELSRLGGTIPPADDEYGYLLDISEYNPGVTLSVDVDRIDFSKAGEAKIKIACKRYSYEGNVSLRVDGVPEGVLAYDGLIPEKKNEVEFIFRRTKEVEAFQVRIFGAIGTGKEEAGGKKGEEFMVSTMPALRKLYPLMMFPTPAMDGWIAVNPSE